LQLRTYSFLRHDMTFLVPGAIYTG
jgi:hypothetical protein